jgi:hypothetical protein
MITPERSLWDYLAAMTPRTATVIGALTLLLVTLGVVGSGPNVVESLDHYASTTNLLDLP